MITYRTFRNWDPPAIVQLWNSAGMGRGAARLIEVYDLESLVFSKPYFDPQGLLLAEDDGRLVGLAHAGFGAPPEGRQLCREFGVIAMLVVAPSHRRRGIGRELARRAADYLWSAGSTVTYAGGIHPVDPFYLGLYGGSEMPGILRSDPAAHRLFESLGYRPVDECLIFQRDLGRRLPGIDRRFKSRVGQLEFWTEPEAALSDWWSACRYGPLQYADFAIRDVANGDVIARARGWEMHPLEDAWNAVAVGIVDFEVHEARRGKGVGTCLMTLIMHHCRDVGLTLAEVQTMARNESARRLYRRLGFREVDRGIVYRAG